MGVRDTWMLKIVRMAPNSMAVGLVALLVVAGVPMCAGAEEADAASAGEDGLSLVANFGTPINAIETGAAWRDGPGAAPVTAGVRYGLDGWLGLDAGIGFRPGLRDATAGLGAASAAPDAPVSAMMGASGFGAGVSARVDINAATGLSLWGARSTLGAGFSAGHLETPAGLYRDGAGAAVAVAPVTDSGVSWSATAGTNVSFGAGLSLDFAYTYTGRGGLGNAGHGVEPGLSPGATAPSSPNADGSGDHGMAMGLRLRF
ncbi:hypothetical protein [Rhodospira trueperi]|uniref:Outer membrane protein beta-barrel domain-containing protein n=1 Tax=Rhodospira trueperi TaxID=69960 RepID=A0A1G7GAH7_9PROT|nr:hypothetical protein [Rhodospira trueperi]SDE85029.1 hypothetical protein SAMN05421720_1142 [Rhodospira trueperi]